MPTALTVSLGPVPTEADGLLSSLNFDESLAAALSRAFPFSADTFRGGPWCPAGVIATC